MFRLASGLAALLAVIEPVHYIPRYAPPDASRPRLYCRAAGFARRLYRLLADCRDPDQRRYHRLGADRARREGRCLLADSRCYGVSAFLACTARERGAARWSSHTLTGTAYPDGFGHSATLGLRQLGAVGARRLVCDARRRRRAAAAETGGAKRHRGGRGRSARWRQPVVELTRHQRRGRCQSADQLSRRLGDPTGKAAAITHRAGLR